MEISPLLDYYAGVASTVQYAAGPLLSIRPQYHSTARGYNSVPMQCDVLAAPVKSSHSGVISLANWSSPSGLAAAAASFFGTLRRRPPGKEQLATAAGASPCALLRHLLLKYSVLGIVPT